jgi:asparagine synthase (glutamine-hydrolysing)
MSAITGVVGKKVDHQQLNRMIQAMLHRGPDNTHIKLLKNGGVAAAEISLSQRATSALTQTDKPVVLLDGDLYNKIPAGMSNVDFIQACYIKEGKNCFSKLDGSFACAILDGDDTILVRDAVGSRPMIYQQQDGHLLFGSEAKALLAYTADVSELPPAHYFSLKEGLNPFKPYIPSIPKFKTPEEAAKVLEKLFVKAVKKQMADGAVKGVALSGGLDSSVTAAVAKSIDPTIKLFSTTIKRYPSKDIKYAKLMAEYLGLEHHIYEITDEDIKKLVPEAIWFMETFDEDCISGAVANFFTSRMIADFTNCVLVGEGADELFGGYFRELKDIPDIKEKERVARRLVEIAYNTALRRLDRGWLANSVNYRTPFLDTEVIAFSNAVSMDLKVRYDAKQDRNVEKWIVREAMRGWLPAEIADRPKLRFAGGTGVDDLMAELTAGNVSEQEFKDHPETLGCIMLTSPKELYYYRMFQERFPKGYETMVARWDPFK